MKDVDVIPRIRQLCEAQGLSYYALAKQSHIPYSTLNNMLNRPKNVPTVYTLSKICEGLNITLEDFFADEFEKRHLSENEKNLLEKWNQLSADDKKLAETYIQALCDRTSNNQKLSDPAQDGQTSSAKKSES